MFVCVHVCECVCVCVCAVWLEFEVSVTPGSVQVPSGFALCSVSWFGFCIYCR